MPGTFNLGQKKPIISLSPRLLWLWNAGVRKQTVAAAAVVETQQTVVVDDDDAVAWRPVVQEKLWSSVNKKTRNQVSDIKSGKKEN